MRWSPAAPLETIPNDCLQKWQENFGIVAVKIMDESIMTFLQDLYITPNTSQFITSIDDSYCRRKCQNLNKNVEVMCRV